MLEAAITSSLILMLLLLTELELEVEMEFCSVLSCFTLLAGWGSMVTPGGSRMLAGPRGEWRPGGFWEEAGGG